MKRRSTGNPFSLFSFQDIITGLCGIIIFFVLIMLVDLVMQREAPTVAEKEPAIPVEDSRDALRREIAELQTRLAELKETTQRLILALGNTPAPDVEAKLIAEMTEKEKEAAAILSQLIDLRMRVAKARDADAENRKKVAAMEKTRRLLEERLAKLKKTKGVTLIPERGEFKAPVFVICGRGGIEVLRPLLREPYRKWYPYGDMESGLSEELEQLDRTTHTVILLIRPSGITRMDALVKIVKELGFSCGRDPLEEDIDVSIGNFSGGGR